MTPPLGDIYDGQGVQQFELVACDGSAFSACRRERMSWLRQPRQLRTDPPPVADLDRFRLMPNGISGAPPESYFASGEPYEGDSFNLSQGKRLYSWFGCAACHGDGRGDIGPS